ncbi:MAG: hypothetical protein ABF242_03660 [Flavobacteriales bacterium]
MNRLQLILSLLFLAIYSVSYSQEEEKIKKFRFGIDLGVDFPNKQYSHFLDGSHPYGASRILGQPTTKQQIEARLGYPILDWEYSSANSYQSSVFTGVYLGFDIKPTLSVVMKFDFSVVRFSTPLVLRLNNPQNFTGEFETAIVNAREQRFLYAIGVEQKFETESVLKPYLAGGLTLNYIQLENQELIVADVTYNIMRVNTSQALTVQQIDGFGYGFYLEGGVTYKLNDKFSLGLGGVFNMQANESYVEKLTVNSAYNAKSIEDAQGLLPSFSAYLRIIWN